jgi:hypothetical protein
MILYKAQKSYTIPVIVLGVFIVVMLAIPDFMLFAKENPISLLPMPVPFIMFGWTYSNAAYYIKDQTEFVSVYGPFKKNIPISSITKIDTNKKHWVGRNHALTSSGILIRYKKFDYIYISAVDNEKLINDLKAINSAIEVNQ